MTGKKILVFSDTHNRISDMRKAVEDHVQTCELIVHLGDGTTDTMFIRQLYPDIPLVTVPGNYESYRDDCFMFEHRGVRILCMHGHSFMVKAGVAHAAEYAAKRGADMLLFGHTHVPFDRRVTTESGRTVHCFNPGSAGMGYPNSYGIISFDAAKDGVYLCSHCILQ